MNHILDIVKDIAAHMDSELPQFQNVYPHLYQIQNGDGLIYPAQFSQGEYSPVLDFGDTNTLYFRIDPFATVSETDRRISSCADTFQERHSCRMVGIWRNTTWDDRAYEILTLAKMKLAEYVPTSSIAPLDRVSIYLNGAGVGKWDIWSQEFRNVPFSLRSDHVMFVVTFDVVFSYSQTNCIESIIPCCDGI